MFQEIAAKLNYENWAVISTELGGRRSLYQVFLHYQSILNKQREGWTQAEDKKLRTAVKSLRHGKFIPWDKVCTRYLLILVTFLIMMCTLGCRAAAWKED